MRTDVDSTALAVFLFFFVLVTIMGFVAARWRRPKTLALLDEWGLGGRQFGTWITWFLVGGDFYTAYTVIAVPALVYSVGAYGFFALPYTIIVYPFVFTVMPKLGLVGEIPLVAAFVILALYTYSSGLRAPALIAFVKDAMIYVAVIAAVALIPG
jgi:SSS family solute:Na+ symporter